MLSAPSDILSPMGPRRPLVFARASIAAISVACSACSLLNPLSGLAGSEPPEEEMGEDARQDVAQERALDASDEDGAAVDADAATTCPCTTF